MTIQYVSPAKLTEFAAEIKNRFVAQEEGKGLSQNDLTDALLRKLENAGDSSFTGMYNDLTGIPTINEVELKGTLTGTDLGLANSSDLPGVATAEEAGLVKPDDVTIKVDASGKLVAQLFSYALKTELPGNATAETAGIVKGDGTTIETNAGVASVVPDVFLRTDQLEGELGEYTKTSDVEAMLEEYITETVLNELLDGYVQTDALTDYARKTDLADVIHEQDLEEKLDNYATLDVLGNTLEDYDTSSTVDNKLKNLDNALTAKLVAVLDPKGSIMYESLPDPSAETKGAFYNIKDSFVTDDRFEDGPDLAYPAGTNVWCVESGDGYKWDIFVGVVDMTGYTKFTDFEEITSEQIQNMLD